MKADRVGMNATAKKLNIIGGSAQQRVCDWRNQINRQEDGDRHASLNKTHETIISEANSK
jgi:hypothetical protein